MDIIQDNSSTPDVNPSEKKKYNGQARFRKFQNNIWGSTMADELLDEMTTQMSSTGVETATKVERGPETFYIDPEMLKKYRTRASERGTKRKRDRFHQEEEVEDGELGDESVEDESDSSVSSGGLSEASIQRIRVMKRTGSRKSKFAKKSSSAEDSVDLDDMAEIEEESDEQFVTNICLELTERNADLMLNLVKVLGRPIMTSILKKVKKIEKMGGLMVKDRSRRRTPGGTFFYIIQHHPKTATCTKKLFK